MANYSYLLLPPQPITTAGCGHESRVSQSMNTHTNHCQVVEVDGPWTLFVQFCTNAGQYCRKKTKKTFQNCKWTELSSLFGTIVVFLPGFSIHLGQPCLSRLSEHLSVILSVCPVTPLSVCPFVWVKCCISTTMEIIVKESGERERNYAGTTLETAVVRDTNNISGV